MRTRGDKSKAKQFRALAGRPRKPGPRQPNGQPSRAGQGPAILPAAIERRAEIVGDRHATDQRAGTAIGRLLLTGRITERQHDAAVTVERAWRRWAALADAPSACARVANLGAAPAPIWPDDDPPREADGPLDEAEAWDRVCNHLAAARQQVRSAVPSGSLLAMAMVESLVVDDVMPPRLCGLWPQGWAMLRAALDALADLYRLPEEKSQEVR